MDSCAIGIRPRPVTLAGRKLASIGLAALAVLSASSSRAANFYVDGANPSCSDSGPGNLSVPYCTITAAIASHSGPGVTINVKPAVYREQVTVPASGLAGNPFVFQALGSPVIIDGADDFSLSLEWTLVSGDVWLTSDVTWSPQQVFADGARLIASTGPPASIPPRSFEFVSGTGLYVNAGGGNPGAHQTLVGRRSVCFYVPNRSNVIIDGFTLTRAESKGISISGTSSDITLTHNLVNFINGQGISITGGSNYVLGSNVVSDNADHGIALISGVTGSVIQDNESFRNMRPTIRAANGIYLYGSPGNRLERNKWHDNQDTGQHMQSGSDNIVSIQNLSWNNGDHGYDHLYATGILHVGDVAYGNYKDGLSIEGSSTGTVIFDCIAIDNGLTSNEFDLWVDSGSASGFVSNYNIFWNSTSQKPFKYGSTQYATIGAYSSASGQDANSTQADPRFVNSAGGDFHLLAGSPAIDDANSSVSNWPTTDFDGHDRVDDPATPNTGVGPVPFADRGALEFLPTGDRAPVVTAPVAASGSANTLISFVVTASDIDGDPIASLTATGMPAGAQFQASPDNTSGTFSWTPTPGDARPAPYNVTFIASNALSGSATTAVTVNPPDRPPVVTAPTQVAGNSGTPISFKVTASDPDGDAIGSLTASGMPAGAQFSTTPDHTSGTFSWTPGPKDVGSYTVTFSATNQLSGSASTSINVTTDHRPVVTAPGAANGSENTLITFNVTASDPDGDPINLLSASGMPAGAQFQVNAGNTSGTFSWTPVSGDARPTPYNVTFIASNALSGSTTTAVTVNPGDRPPVVTAPAQVAGASGTPLSFTVTASDPDGDAINSLTASGMPPGAQFNAAPDHRSGTFSWTPDLKDMGSHSVTFTATNQLSGSATTSINVREDHPPVVTAPAAVSGLEGTLISFTVTASDADGDPIASLTASGMPVGAQFQVNPGNTSGTFSWTPASGDAQPTPYNLTFIAANALSGSATTAVTVRAVNHPPVVTAPAQMDDPPGIPISFKVTASDPDGEAIGSLTASGMPAEAQFDITPDNMSGTFTWTPGPSDIGSYTVIFDATNSLAGSASTSITVTTDHRPVVTAPAAASSNENTLITFTVTASDVDGDPINLLSASGMPSGAQFQVNAQNTSGTFSWIPVTGDARQAPYKITFIASNALSGSATTAVTVTPASAAVRDRNLDAFAARVVPDPTAGEALLSFVTKRPGSVRIELFDLDGRRVRGLLDSGFELPGSHQVGLDGRDDRGVRLRSGVYFYLIQAVEGVSRGRFLVLN